MNRPWCIIVMISFIMAIVSGRAGATAQAVLEGGDAAVTMLLKLTGSMVLWSGMMEILHASGDVERMGCWLRKGLKGLFPSVEDHASWSAMGMNMAANLLGLGNAATPAGVQAAQLLSRQGEGGARALAMLLVINNTSPQVIPSTVMALRRAAGARNPADIWPVTMAASLAATAAGVGLMLLLQRKGGRHE